jgi:ketosteroid isomerase-like protein
LNIPAELLAAGGARQGKAEAIARLQAIFSGFDTQYLEPGEIIVRGNCAMLEVHSRCQDRATGKWLDTTKKHVWLLEDGWPVKLSEFYDLEQFEIFMHAARRSA